MLRTSRNAFTMMEMIITVSIIAILLAIAIPNMMGYRRGAEKEGCKDQMRSILSAIEEARLERDYDVIGVNDGEGLKLENVSAAVLWNGTHKYLPEEMTCPSGGNYTVHYHSDSKTWTVTCPNASKGHTL